MRRSNEFDRLRHIHELIKAGWQANLLLCMVILYQQCDWDGEALADLKQEYCDKAIAKARIVNKAYKGHMTQAEEIDLINDVCARGYEFVKKYLRQQYNWSREDIKLFANYYQEFQLQYMNDEINIFELNKQLHDFTGVWAIRPKGEVDEAI